MTSSYDVERTATSARMDFDSAWQPQEPRYESQPASLAPSAPARANIFNSFWMADFEGSDHVNRHGQALAFNELTQHQGLAAADYQRVSQFQMRTVRESIGWRLSDKAGQFDFTHLEQRARAASASGTQVIWTLLHYGWPEDLDVLSDAFVQRFASYAGAAARYLARYHATPAVYAPIHEISYLTWALCENKLTQPGRRDLRGRGRLVKRQLVRAALAACDAIWAVDPRARILHTDPLIHIAAPVDRPELALAAEAQREMQFETFDMLAGRIATELGGAPRYLDLVGLNYFPGNQWELSTGRPLAWYLRDPRRLALADLLAEVYERYERPLLIAETGHAGVGRGGWIRDVAEQVGQALKRGVPVAGVCLYAVVDRPEWDNPSHWHCSGLWDLEINANGALERKLNTAYASELQTAQANLRERLHAQETPRRASSQGRAMRTTRDRAPTHNAGRLTQGAQLSPA